MSSWKAPSMLTMLRWSISSRIFFSVFTCSTCRAKVLLNASLESHGAPLARGRGRGRVGVEAGMEAIEEGGGSAARLGAAGATCCMLLLHLLEV